MGSRILLAWTLAAFLVAPPSDAAAQIDPSEWVELARIDGTTISYKPDSILVEDSEVIAVQLLFQAEVRTVIGVLVDCRRRHYMIAVVQDVDAPGGVRTEVINPPRSVRMPTGGDGEVWFDRVCSLPV